MLKLLKYEVIQSYRQYLLTFGAFFILCIVAPFLPSFISGVLSSLIIFAFMGISIAILVNVIVNFNRSMYKRPGYLTLTLPVSTEKLVGAKFLGSLIWVFVSSIVLTIGVVILVFLVGELPIDVIFNALGELIGAIFENFGIVMVNLLDSLTMVSSMILSFYATITLTKTKYIPKYKTAIGMVLYVVVLILGINILLWNPIAEFIAGLDTISSSVFSIVINLILSVGFYLLTVYLIDHKIEVE